MQLQETLSQIEEKQPLVTIACLDCCREDPDDHRGLRASRGSIFGGGGLSALQGPAGSLVMYAAGEGKLAADAAADNARNGAFTAALLQHLGTPGLELSQMAVKVANTVKEKTGGRQIPEHINRLTRSDLCLVQD